MSGWRRASWAIVALAAAGPALSRAGAEEPQREPSPALTMRLVHPEVQGQRVLDLFRNTRAPHPAAALAAWRRARPEDRRGLGKGPEALIALVNPETIAELHVFDGAELALTDDAAAGRTRWFATLPRDDGTVAALATAMALTDGASEPPLGAVPVDRLGPPGSGLMARPGQGQGVVVAGTRDDLRAGLARLDSPAVPPWPAVDPGVLFRIDAARLGSSPSLPRRRLAQALRGLGCERLEGQAVLEGETVRVTVNGFFSAAPPARAAIDPAWLEAMPAQRVLAAVALALDPRPEVWDTLFEAADRVEKADPARAGVAPLRTRINLIALAAKVQPEVELWPHLRGVSACVTADPAGSLDGALLALHVADDAAADRIAARVVPALAARFVKGSQTEPQPDAKPQAATTLGVLAGRPLHVRRRGTTVQIGWGGILASCSQPDPQRVHWAHQVLRPGAGLPQRFGALWPGRWPGLASLGVPASLALSEAPPVVWSGSGDGKKTRDVVAWTGLHGLVQRFLERLPMEPGAGG